MKLLRTVWLGLTFALGLKAGQVRAQELVPPFFQGCEESFADVPERSSCSNQKLAEFLKQNITYPDSARKAGIEGAVVVSFVINAEGQIESPNLTRDIGLGCGAEALRVISLMPPWSPATEDGMPVSYTFVLPVRFNLTDSKVQQGRPLLRISWGQAYADFVNTGMLTELAGQKIAVRDLYGQTYAIEQLSILYGRDEAHLTELSVSGDQLSAAMQRRVRHARPGHLLIVKAVVQDGAGKQAAIRKLRIIPKTGRRKRP